MPLRLLVFVCMLLLALCPGESEGEAKKLQIGVKKRPEECPIKTKPGDRVHMHYKVKGWQQSSQPLYVGMSETSDENE